MSLARALATVLTAAFALLIILLKCPGVAPVESWGDTQLSRDLNEFEKLLLRPEVVSGLLRIFALDPDAGATLRFLGTARFRRRCLAVDELPEIHELSQLLAEEGVGLRSSLRIFAEQMEFVYRRARRRANKRLRASGEPKPVRGSLQPSFEEVKKILPSAEIQQLYRQKMEESEVFRKFVDLLGGEDGQIILKKITSFREYRTFRDALKQRDVDIKELASYVLWLFNGENHQSSLKQSENNTETKEK